MYECVYVCVHMPQCVYMKAKRTTCGIIIFQLVSLRDQTQEALRLDGKHLYLLAQAKPS